MKVQYLDEKLYCFTLRLNWQTWCYGVHYYTNICWYLL